MINISEELKDAYRNGGNIRIRINLPNYSIPTPTDIPSECIGFESMELKESLSESDSIEFIGCISSQFKVTINNYNTYPLKNELIYVYCYTIKDDGTTTDEIPLFRGIVDDVAMQANNIGKTITAYDWLYTLGKNDVADWYNGLSFPITLKDFRDSLFEHLQLDQVEKTLPCDNVRIAKQYEPVTLKALHVIKSICQINCVFGIIDRYGKFDYRTLPNSGSVADEEVAYYKTIDYQEYTVDPVDKIWIRQSEDDEGVTYGSGYNTYIIQNNMFTYGLDAETLQDIVEAIYPNVYGFAYHPFKSDQNGLPYVEAGDIVRYGLYDFVHSSEEYPVYNYTNFYILSRTIKGIQNLRDNYSAQGDEYQREFVTDLQSMIENVTSQIEIMKEKVKEYSNNYLLFSNAQERVIGHDQTVMIAEAQFAVVKPVPVLLMCEYHINVVTDSSTDTNYDYVNLCDLEVVYALGEATGEPTVITSWSPKEIFDDGTHILSLMYVIGIEDTRTHKFRISIKSSNGTITIPRGKGYSVITGQGLVGATWDGNIVADDNYPNFTFNFINTFTDSVTAEKIIPEIISNNDNLPLTVFRFINTFTDSVTADKDMVRAYYGDGLSTYTCRVVNNTWTGSGTVTTGYVKDTTSIEVFGDSGVEYQMSTDGSSWYGYVNGTWTLNATMNKTTIEALTTFLGSKFKVKATLANNAKLSAIQFNGGKVDA